MAAPSSKNPSLLQPLGECVDTGELKLAWGDASKWKAYFREQSQRRYLDQPIEERLLVALSLVVRRSNYDQAT